MRTRAPGKDPGVGIPVWDASERQVGVKAGRWRARGPSF